MESVCSPELVMLLELRGGRGVARLVIWVVGEAERIFCCKLDTQEKGR